MEAVRSNEVWYKKSIVYWFLTLTLATILSWSLAAYVSPFVFNHYEIDMFRPVKAVISALYSIGPYAVFIGGISGVIWYNISIAHKYRGKDYWVSSLSSIGGSFVFGLIIFLLIVASVIIVLVFTIIIFTIAFRFYSFLEQYLWK
ncbi:MAG: hypothetical protein LBO67_06905 [Spirochaetaceae bacterium]|jgi:hypothetical protein|nr:hypothetical protein [Spirochaetaceae bacterium]